jgi:hypothetical protein
LFPPGWTVAGLVQHLGDAERHWFQQVVTGAEDDLPWDEGRPAYDPKAALTCERPSTEVLAYYRQQCQRSDAVLDVTPISAAPKGVHNPSQPDEEVTNVRWVILHMIEETACHSGHLDIARELLDGQTDRGLR